MNQMNFGFNCDIYNYWSIYLTIQTYYPIGIFVSSHKLYNDYPGIKALNLLIEKNIFNKSDMGADWATVQKKITAELNKTVIGTTNIMSPSLSAYVDIEINEFKEFDEIKTVHCVISLLGPYYTIIGEHKFKYHQNSRTFFKTDYLLVSPVDEYSDAFLLFSREVDKQFKGYRFVPYFIYSRAINGLEVVNQNKPSNIIFHALFNSLFNSSNKIIGEMDFLSNQWLKEKPDFSKSWESFPP